MRDMKQSFAKLGEEQKRKIEVLVKKVSIEAANTAKDKVTENQSVLSGFLRNGIRHEIEAYLNGWKVTGKVKSNADYSASIEYGRSPGTFPKVGDGTKQDGGILYWVKRKKLAGTYSIKTKRRTGNKATRDAQDKAVAFAIGRHIKQFGTKPRPFMRPSYEMWSKRFAEEAQKIMRT